MKVKQSPDDFVVREEIALPLVPDGPFSVYTLRKQHVNTLDAIAEIRRRWEMAADRIAVAGLKDRHADTEQTLTIRRGPPRDFKAASFSLQFRGRSRQAADQGGLRGNHFSITLRAMTETEARIAETALRQVRETGWPNYFDAQRFGSARHGQGWFARALMDGDEEKALRLMIATPAAEDAPDVRGNRATLATHWGKWDAAAKALPRSSERSLVCYLRDHPTDFRGACERLDRSLARIALFAYQSWLWNETVGWLLRKSVPAADLEEVPYAHGAFVFPVRLDAATGGRLRAMHLPLLDHRVKIEDPLGAEASAAILAREGLTPTMLKIRRLRTAFIKSVDRPLWLAPGDLVAEAPVPDDRNPGHLAWRLSFTLPPGAYATILLKRLGARRPPAPR